MPPSVTAKKRSMPGASKASPKLRANINRTTPVKTKAPQAANPLQILLSLEGEAMAAKDRLSLKHIAVNKPRALIETGHIFFVRRNGKQLIFEAISSQSTVDKNTPFLQWLTRELAKGMKTLGPTQPHNFKLNTHGDAGFEYPFDRAFWAPFAPDPSVGGLLFTRDKDWPEAEQAIPVRLAHIYGLQWTALGRKKRARLTPQKRWILGVSALALAIIACIPVPLTTLAPAEIVAADPFIVSAPMDGVIKTLNILPNTIVTKGTVLATFEDTSYRNEFDIASEEMSVAQARSRQTGLSAFVDDLTKRNLAVARAEQNLARTRQSYAADMLDKTVLRAEKDGLVLYSDVKDWMGRPVATGERIMEIADPSKVQIRLEASIHDSAALTDAARVRLFMDSNPLHPIEAKLTRSSFYAQPQAGGNLAYEAYADFTPKSEQSGEEARIGGRGVAKIYGESAPLGYWLLRRPIVTVRQFFGI